MRSVVLARRDRAGLMCLGVVQWLPRCCLTDDSRRSAARQLRSVQFGGSGRVTCRRAFAQPPYPPADYNQRRRSSVVSRRSRPRARFVPMTTANAERERHDDDEHDGHRGRPRQRRQVPLSPAARLVVLIETTAWPIDRRREDYRRDAARLIKGRSSGSPESLQRRFCVFLLRQGAWYGNVNVTTVPVAGSR